MTIHLSVPLARPAWRLEEERVVRPPEAAPTYSLYIDGGSGSVHITGLSIDAIQMLQFAICNLRQSVEARAGVHARQLAEMRRLDIDGPPGTVRITGAECDGLSSLPGASEVPVFAEGGQP